MKFKAFFAENGLSPAPDTKLSTLLEQTLSYMKEDDLESYIKSVQRFNKQPVTIAETLPGQHLIDFGRGKTVYWYYLRKDLEKMPDYFTAAQKANLPYEQAVDLLSTMIASEKYDFSDVTFNIGTLTKILDTCAERNLDCAASLSALKSVMKSAKSDGDLSRALGITMLGLNAGMDMAQSADIVNTIYEKSAIAGYVLMRLHDELNLLASNTADGTLLYQSLQKVMGKDPYYEADFQTFTQVLYTVAANTEHSQEDVLLAIGGKPASKLLGHANENFERKKPAKTTAKNPLAKAIKLLHAEGKAETSVKEPEGYFPALDKTRLVHGILPYKMDKGFSAGVADLKELMKEEYSEGAFIFDPAKETWYSLGGRTRSEPGRVRQEFFPYDVSKLSANPVFVHVHPEKSETMVSPNCDSLAYPEFQVRLMKFLAAMPSGADLDMISTMMTDTSSPVTMSAYIVTSTGLTEMRFPNDAGAVKALAGQFRDLKDRVLLEFDAYGYLAKNGVNEDHPGFVRDLTKHLNALLPAGFEVVQHPYESVPQPAAALQVGAGRQPKLLKTGFSA